MPTRSNASPQARAAAEIEIRRRVEAGAVESSPYAIFRAKYRNDPAGFVRDCFRWETGESPASYQKEPLENLIEHRRISIRGPHGLGKTALAAWVILWFALTSDGEDWKIPATASAWRQLSKFLFPEVHKWARRIKWDIIGREPFNSRTELLTLSLKLSTGEAFALASDNPALIEGAHAKRLLYVFDESKEIQPDTWDAAEGAFSSGECYWLAISTPGEPQGRFYDIHRRAPGYEDWWVRHVTQAEAIAAGHQSSEWAESRRTQWGESSAVYQNRVLGEFASSDEDGVISLASVERSNRRWQERFDIDDWDDFFGVGVDVGRGGDMSVQALRYGNAIKELRRTNSDNTMEIVGLVNGLLTKHVRGITSIDVIGIGAGVVDRLRENRAISSRVNAFNAGEKTALKEKTGELGFVNMRSCGWWTLRELLNDDAIDLPPDDKLTGDLTAPHWRSMSEGKIQVESKDDIRKRIKRSTDDGDAVMMIFAPLSLGPSDEVIAAYAGSNLQADPAIIGADMVKYLQDSGVRIPEKGE
jgi:hypothetical protein